MKNVGIWEKRATYVLAFGLLVVLGGLIVLWSPNSQEPNEASEQTQENNSQVNRELPGTIVCYEPWGERTNRYNQPPPQEAYRGAISVWRSDLHISSHLYASTSGGGRVYPSSTTVMFRDDNGNEVSLLNYPCRITMPSSED